jgi:hypothetical protein
MKASQRPADTRMMGIVHAALRRHLLRLRTVVDSRPHPRGQQRAALGECAVWMMEFLHSHHTLEDEHLWPLIRRRDPSVAPLLDSLEADHREIAPAAAELTHAGRRYAASSTDEARLALIAAIDDLSTVLLPHLDREVAEAMPVVSATISHAEWRAFEQREAMKARPVSQLAIEAHWVLDGIEPEDFRITVRSMPTLARFIVLYGYGRAYRKQAQRRWQPDPAPETIGTGP